MMTRHLDCDVAVTGAGPVGLTLALLLHQYGHNVHVYERHQQRYPLPRAVGLDHQSLRIYDDLGLSKQMFDEKAVQNFEQRLTEIMDGKGNIIVSLPIFQKKATSGTVDGFPIHQPTFEAFLETACTTRGIKIIRGAEVTGVAEKDDHVEVSVARRSTCNVQQNGDITPAIRASIVVGCDGANSVVRQSANIKWLEQPGAKSRWLVVDVLPRSIEQSVGWKDGDIPRHYLDPKRPRNSVISPSTRRRWEFMVHPHESAETVMSDEFIWALLEEYAVRPDTAILERRTTYQVKGAWAEVFGKGRIVLAGDAAHITPQFLGQGLNGGLRDAKAISWRLDFALRHKEADWHKFLQHYSSEQLGLTQVFVHGALAFEGLFTLTDEAAAEQRNKMMQAGGNHFQPDMEKLGEPGFYDTTLQPHKLPGRLFLRDRVEKNGHSDWLDILAGSGWLLVGGTTSDPYNKLSPETKERFKDVLRGSSVRFGGESGYNDLSGRYTEYFTENSAKAVLVRPDYYIYGVAATDDQIESIVMAALDYLVQ